MVYTLCRLAELFLEYYLVEFQVSEGGWKGKKNSWKAHTVLLFPNVYSFLILFFSKTWSIVFHEIINGFSRSRIKRLRVGYKVKKFFLHCLSCCKRLGHLGCLPYQTVDLKLPDQKERISLDRRDRPGLLEPSVPILPEDNLPDLPWKYQPVNYFVQGSIHRSELRVRLRHVLGFAWPYWQH